MRHSIPIQAVVLMILSACGDSPTTPEMEVNVEVQAFAGGEFQFRVAVEHWDGSMGDFSITACPQVFGDCVDPVIVETTTFSPPTYTSTRYSCSGFRGRVFGTATVGDRVGRAHGDCNP
jgi:hypothetical protein